MEALSVFTDGGSRGNPGPAAVGIVFSSGAWQESFGLCIGEATNNVAEYRAIQEALKRIATLDKSYAKIHFFLDSELVVRQLNGIYKVKDANLLLIYQQVKLALNDLKASYCITHIPRTRNKLADCEVNKALDNSHV